MTFAIFNSEGKIPASIEKLIAIDNAGAKSFEMFLNMFGGKLSCPVLNLSDISLRIFPTRMLFVC